MAGAAGRMNTIDFHFDCRQTYTFWSGLIGGLFLTLSYFGCDQSQVQRYLTAKSVNQARHSLLMSAFVKIPLQVAGPDGRRVHVRVLPVQPAADAVQHGAHGAGRAERARRRSYRALEGEFAQAFEQRRAAATTLAAASGPERDAARDAFTAATDEIRRIRGRAAQLVQGRHRHGDYGDKTGDTPKPTSTTSSRRSSRRGCRMDSSA